MSGAKSCERCGAVEMPNTARRLNVEQVRFRINVYGKMEAIRDFLKTSLCGECCAALERWLRQERDEHVETPKEEAFYDLVERR